MFRYSLTRQMIGTILVLLLCAPGCGDDGGQRSQPPGDTTGGSDALAPGICSPGTLGCACLDDETCEGLGLSCATDGTCQAPGCPRGTPGCGCTGDGLCSAPAQCVQGICLLDSMLAPPAAPQCYTPCRAGRQDDEGTWVPCPADGLMPGCLDRFECVDGSCQPLREDKTDDIHGNYDPCATPQDCPDWQTCIQGKCYSICDSDMECPAGLDCVRHVCRIPCDVVSAPCPNGMTCETDSGGPGHCLHQAQIGAAGTGTVTNTFTVDETAYTFTNADGRVNVTVKNEGPAAMDLVVEKVVHTKFTDLGPVDIETNPLGWLRMGAYTSAAMAPDDLTAVASFTLSLAANEEVTMGFLDIPDDCGLDRWEGMVRIEGLVGEASQGIRWLHLRFMGSPEGRWSGTIHTFANFPAGNLDKWLADKDSYNIQNLDNAFIKRWLAFKQGDIALDEFMAVLNATDSESWKWASVDGLCQETYSQQNAACYLYADPWGQSTSGVGLYTQNLQQDAIPTGATTLPFALNIRMDGSPEDWSGRVESSGALHYPGNPALHLSFEADPATCQSTHPLSGTCLTYLADLEVDALLGGRGLSPDGTCDTYGADFALATTPWLIPGFRQGTAETETGPILEECRNRTLPFGDDTDWHQVNATFSAANPIPNGLPLTRRIRLVDGALVNQKTLLILFQEIFDATISPNHVESFSSYGYILLNKDPATLEGSEYVGSTQAGSGAATPHFYPLTCGDSLRATVAEQIEEPGIPHFLTTEFPLIDPAAAPPGQTPCEASGSTDTCRAAVRALASSTLQGFPDSGVPPLPMDPTRETVHYFCEDNGTIDQGPPGAEAPCPPGSKVVWFAASADVAQATANFGALPCNQAYSLQYEVSVATDPLTGLPGNGIDEDASLVFAVVGDGTPGTCGAWMDTRQVAWQCASHGGAGCSGKPVNGSQACVSDAQCPSEYHCADDSTCWSNYRFNVLWQCDDPNAAYCDDDRYDLTVGKVFYGDTFEAAVMVGLQAQIDQAFRYKTKFMNQAGTSLAFAPYICDDGAGDLSYCYDPTEVEASRARVECLEHLYTYYGDDLLATDEGLSPDARLFPRLGAFLRQTLAYDDQSTPGLVKDGFERLYSELLIMMGDEAFSAAFASRFDIGGFNVASFPGDQLEPGGINLSGGAGFEMRNLYLAAQYYQAALDRFYALMPTIWESFSNLPADDYYVTQATAAHYFERLVRASGQKSRAWSEIAKRYQKFNRPDLAQRVIERAYTAGYMESVVFNGLFRTMRELYKDTADEAQIVFILEQAQLRYRQGLLEMRDVYRDLTNELTYFGYAPDYIPFPAVEDLGAGLWNNAFDVLLDYATKTMDLAAEKEDLAISTMTSFNVDYESFEAELAAIQASYETELLEICGSFEGEDGNIYPAVDRYADRHREAQELMAVAGTLCGLTGDGQLHTAMVQATLATLDVDALAIRQQNIIASAQIEKERVESYCEEQLTFANFLYGEDGLVTQANNLEEQIADSERAIGDLRRYVDTFGTSCGILNAGDIYLLGNSIALGMIYDVWNIITEATVAGVQIGIAVKERKIHDLQESAAWWELSQDCDLALVDSNAVVKNILLGLNELELDALKAHYQVLLTVSDIKHLQNRARQLQDLQAEAEQHAIDIVAAMNDPNVRIYKNDAVLAADRSFHRALKAAYKATKVYEYYTSQSYAHLWDLFLVRSVSHGDTNLENYMAELEDAFYEFEEAYGNPDLRVKTISLADDLLAIPAIHDSCGEDQMCSLQERAEMLRTALGAPSLVDPNGYIVIPFSTTVSALSPLTYNHKLHCVEVELQGSFGGDDVARVYLRQQGVGTIRGLDGGAHYYAFPRQTAVVDAWLGQKVFDDKVYQTFRFKDRPVANTGWELVINLLDEADNLDLGLLEGLTDLRLHLYYMDFTNY